MGAATTTLEDLHQLLEVAQGVLTAIADNDDLRRLLAALERIPGSDRATIVAIIEREADLRQLSETTARHTGVRLERPNPHARLYVRSVEGADDSGQEPEHARMVHASIEAAKRTCLLFRPDLHHKWRAALAEAFANLDPDVRADVARLAREMLDVLAATESPGVEVNDGPAVGTTQGTPT